MMLGIVGLGTLLLIGLLFMCIGNGITEEAIKYFKENNK